MSGSFWADLLFAGATILCGEVRIPVHRCVLVAVPPFFAKACQGQMREARQAVVKIDDVKSETTEVFLRFSLVAESLEYLVEESLSGLGKGVWAKQRDNVLRISAPSSCQCSSGTGEAISLVQRTAKDYFTHFDASRTFVCIHSGRRNPDSVVQSSTNR